MPTRQLEPHGRLDHAVALASVKSSSTSACWSESSVATNASAASTTSETLESAVVAAAVEVEVAVVEAWALGRSWTDAAFAVAYTAPRSAADAAAVATIIFLRLP
ncbi:hypothetical protein [Streptomyces sp. NPDC046909]|uniref:hypothetical protein n=1 Tax=Streptomyces sp. NPDC046909 TaxID=3155617 RepID=UPI0033C930C0